jgi:hypothetical protein
MGDYKRLIYSDAHVNEIISDYWLELYFINREYVVKSNFETIAKVKFRYLGTTRTDGNTLQEVTTSTQVRAFGARWLMLGRRFHPLVCYKSTRSARYNIL